MLEFALRTFPCKSQKFFVMLSFNWCLYVPLKDVFNFVKWLVHNVWPTFCAIFEPIPLPSFHCFHPKTMHHHLYICTNFKNNN